MIIPEKLIEDIPLDMVEDGNERIAIRPYEQTFTGIKTFNDLRIPSDPEQNDKSLANKSDLMNAIAEMGTTKTNIKSITLTNENINNKSLELDEIPIINSGVYMYIDGSNMLTNYNNDFNITDKTISWNHNTQLISLLDINDNIHIKYTTILED